ncbi:MAG TPA: oligosaccharide flippase family protein [Anaerohalosphaeraceae bacterium]|nr:oligosaccharide flippase family protein [Anaerohalosphaeraceae bacterium]
MMKAILSKISNPDSLKAKSLKGSFYLTCGTVIDRGLAFIRNMILTRLLFPEEMGIMVILLSIIGLFEVLTDVGIKVFVIQNPRGAELEFLNMTWWFQVVRGVGLFMAGFLLTPLAFWFFFSSKSDVLTLHSDQEIIMMIRIIFISVLFHGFMSPASYVLEKELKFSKVVFLNQGTAILGTLLTIGLCFYYKSVWAMIWSYVIVAGLRSFLSYTVCPFVPKVSVHWHCLNEQLNFTRRMFGLSFLTYLGYNLDIIILGRLVSAKEVGLYGMAVALAAVSRDLFNKIINPVLLPAFSKKQDQREILSIKVMQISRYISITGFCFLPFILVFGAKLISLIYGPAYVDASQVFILRCFVAFILLHSNILANVLLAKGKPEKHRLFTLVRVLIIGITIYPMVKKWGLNGGAISVISANIVAFLLQIKVIKKLIGFPEKKYWRQWSSGFLGFCISIGLALSIREMLPENINLSMVFSGLLCGLVFLCYIYNEFGFKHKVISCDENK